ncbi:MAG: efflux RND transporter permease subunit [Pyrinomonadaceae bacterium]
MQKLAEICVRRPVFATMLILSLTVVGAFSYRSLGVDLFPKIDLPTITVSVLNPGASPQEIETEITDKVEGAVNTISGIDELRSTSVEGVSQVFISFVLEKNADVAAQEVRNKIELIQNDLPETAETPIVQKLDTDATPVLRIALSAPRSLREVTDIADKQIKRQIEPISGVGNVQIVGGRQREIQVWLDTDKMRAYNVSAADVSNAVRVQNMELPGGRVEEGKREMTVRTMGRVTDAAELNNIVIANRGVYAVKISDIGYVEDGAEEQRTEARLNGQPAVTLVISKQSGQNTVAVADAVKERLEELKKTLPSDVKVQLVGDQTIFIKASLDAIQLHLIEGSILAAIVVFVFLWSFRSTFIAAIAIPTSIIATFGLMAAMGFTMNQITMLALTLMVGIVIDDAVVVLENIFRYVEEKGAPPFQAAIDGTKEIGLAVTATTLSLLAVFLPVGFMAGMVGRFMSSFGFTASFAIAVSLLVSFTLTPMLAARMIKRKQRVSTAGDSDRAKAEHKDDSSETTKRDYSIAEFKEKYGQAHSKEGRFYRPIDRAYTGMLKWSMAHRWAIVGLSVFVIFSTIPLFMFVGKNFLPVDDQSQFEVNVRVPEGSTLSFTSALAERMAVDLRKLPGVTDTLVTIGSGQQQIVNIANIYVKLTPIEERSVTQNQLMARAREEVVAKYAKEFPDQLRTSINSVAAISGGGFRNADIQYVIGGPDLDKLTQYSNSMLAKLKTVPDVVDADSSLIAGKPELRVVIDRARAGDLGVRIGDIAQSLNTLVAGQKVSTFNAGVDQYDIRVRAMGQYRANAEGLQRMIVASQKLGWVSLDNLVRVEEGTGPSSIERYNRQRQVMLTANTKPGGSQTAVIARLEQFADEERMESTYQTSLAGRSKELTRTGYYFLLAIVLSFIFMYMVLAAQFESFIHPVTILLTLPLAIPFGILSLLVTGQTVNIFSGLGLLLLFGVVKKNAILQIDHTNGLRRQGMERHEAIIQANRDRLRPILMTTIALVAGMLPLTISSGPGSGTNRSIGVLVVGGQSLCLLLTLLAVPVFYSLFDDLARSRVWARIGSAIGGVFGRARKRAATAAASLIGPMFKTLIIASALMLMAAHRGLAQEPVASPTPAPMISAQQTLKLPTIAIDYRADATKPLPALTRIGVDVDQQKPITLREAIVLALSNNKDIEVARDNVQLAEADLLTVRGAYDPRFTAQSYYERIKTPATSFLNGTSETVESSAFANTARLEGLASKFGGNYRVDFSSMRQTTNKQFTVLNPSYPTALTFSFTQPLLRGRSFDLPRRNIEVAKKNLSLTDAQFRQRSIEVITQVQRSYWDLVFTLRNLQIQRESLNDARTQLEHNRRMVGEGTLAPIDIIAAQTQVANLEQAEFSALEDVNRAENNLKNLIAENQSAPIWNASLVPTDDVDLTVPRVVLTDAMKAAIENRPELRQSDLVREINQLDQKLHRDMTKPQIDFIGSYGMVGNAGALTSATNPFSSSNDALRARVNELSTLNGLQPLPPPPTATIPSDLIGGYPRSIGNLATNEFNNFRVGVTFSFPLRNRTAEGQLAHALTEGKRIATQRQQLEQLIQVEVRNALQSVTTAEARLRSAAVARENAEQQYASEKRKLDVGQSTVFLVLERQTALTIARGNELRAQTDLNKAIAELQRATGNSLTANNVNLK